MKLTFITNACCIYESQGYKILCDPWLTDGAFYGSWFHDPPLKTKPEDVADYDALYISHLHPDHFDPKTLKAYDRNKPVLILDRKPNYLERMLRYEGFWDIRCLPPGFTACVGAFRLTMYEPFCNHPFFEGDLGNPIDSALVVDDGEFRILNANDNTPNLESAKRLHDLFGQFDLAQLNYNAAGPYPSCFSNLSLEQKRTAHRDVLKRNLDHVVALCRILKPKYFMPFAGAYQLGGRFAEKNKYLGTTTPEFAAGYVRMALPGQDSLVLGEGISFDLSEPEQFATSPYDYDQDPIPASPEIGYLISEARKNLRRKQKELNCFPNCTLLINGKYFVELGLEEMDDKTPLLKADLDPSLLFRILTRRAHWNNAEIGCHIEFHREPDVYNPDVHLLMSYFHT